MYILNPPNPRERKRGISLPPFIDMDNTPNQISPIEVSEKVASPTPHSHKHLPHFPDEDTPAQWIWPPFAGRNLLNEVFKYPLKPRLQSDGTWVINAKNQWYCFSRSHWLYLNESSARDALHANMHKHLQCSPILSEQRCVAVASDIQNTWRLWQIVHAEPTLAGKLAKALQEEQVEKLVLETFRCATFYTNALHQGIQYPLLLNLTLENLGIDSQQQLVYLSYVDEKTSNAIQPTTEDMLFETIKQTFATSITKALSRFDKTTIVNEFKKIDDVEQQYLAEILIQLCYEPLSS